MQLSEQIKLVQTVHERIREAKRGVDVSLRGADAENTARLSALRDRIVREVSVPAILLARRATKLAPEQVAEEVAGLIGALNSMVGGGRPKKGS